MTVQPHSNGVLLDKFKGALLFSAVGDALGWPTEFGRYPAAAKKRSGKSYVDEFVSWNKLVGGRFWGYREAIAAGEYSDDTQLTLAIHRCIDESGNFQPDRFAYFELPLWLHYERGGGKTIKSAARKLNQSSKEWNRNFYSTKDLSYRNAGANGAAMRVLPIALANLLDLQKLRTESFLNSIITHGHPRAILGCILYASAVWFLLKEKEFTTSSFLQFLNNNIENDKQFFDNGNIVDWMQEWDRHPSNGASFQRVWQETKQEIGRYLSAIRQKQNLDDREYYNITGALTDAMRGSGTSTVCCAIFLLCKYAADPSKALLTAVNLLGSDTDTISGFLGGLLGSLYGTSAIPENFLNNLQDKAYIVKSAERLYQIVTGEAFKDFAPADSLDREDSYLRIMAWEIGLHELFWDALDLGESLLHPALGRGRITEKRVQPLQRSDYQVKLIHVAFDCGQTCIFHSRVSKDGRLSESLGEDAHKVLVSLEKEHQQKLDVRHPTQTIQDVFVLEKPQEVNQFLKLHKYLYNALPEIAENISKFFENHAKRILLTVDRDPEEHYEGISVLVETDLDPVASLNLLQKFDENWWLDVDERIRLITTILVRPS